MTLRRQLLILIVLLFALVLLGTLSMSVHNRRAYLAEQLGSHAQDAATSLGLSLSPHAAGGDLATMQALVDAMFDSGDYRLIDLISVDGEPLLTRRLDNGIAGVPGWFERVARLQTPTGEAQVMAGWHRFGTVHVASHPGFAYQELWRSTIGTIWVLVLVGGAGLLVGLPLLQLVLRPLRDMERQAEAISNREFRVLERVPRTRDLRRVVLAMNRMAQKVRQMLDEQIALTERAREQARRDPVTGLGNRSYFEQELAALVDSDEQDFHGVLGLLQVANFKAYNDRLGFVAGDELLRFVGEQVEQVCQRYGAYQLARLGGADFGLLVWGAEGREAQALADALAQALAAAHGAGLVQDEDVGHAGLVPYDGEQTTSQWLARADLALRSAQSQGANGVLVMSETPLARSRNASEWRRHLEQVIDAGDITLHAQPVVDLRDRERVLHRELLLRIRGDDGLLPAGLFMPMAERLGLMPALDRLVIEHVLGALDAAEYPDGNYCINVNPTTLDDDTFLAWLQPRLAGHPARAARLLFEVPEYGASTRLDAVRRLADALHGAGAGFGLDRFGRGLRSFAWLGSLKVSHIKVDSSFVRHIDGSRDNQFFMQALAEVAHGLEGGLYAEAVETEAEWGQLVTLGVDGAQGYLIARPGPL